MTIDGNAPIYVSLIIPCYNESDRVDLLFSGIASFLEHWQHQAEIIIVNDGSKDDTEQKLIGHPTFQKYRDYFTIVKQVNTGKGGALKNGVLRAKGNFILTLDADMASPPSELIKWMHSWQDKPNNATIYVGSREHVNSIIKNKGNRKVIGNIFNLIVRVLTPLNVRDTQCGFKFYPAAEAKRIFATLFTLGWAHDVEILYKAHIDNMKIVEMPLEWNAVEGSKIRVFRDSIRMFTEVLGIVVKTKKQYKKPVHKNK
jgi:dolichyl-phosphate beta-glucosyltransferase